MQIILLRDCNIKGEHGACGSIHTVDQKTGYELIGIGKASVFTPKEAQEKKVENKAVDTKSKTFKKRG